MVALQAGGAGPLLGGREGVLGPPPGGFRRLHFQLALATSSARTGRVSIWARVVWASSRATWAARIASGRSPVWAVCRPARARSTCSAACFTSAAPAATWARLISARRTWPARISRSSWRGVPACSTRRRAAPAWAAAARALASAPWIWASRAAWSRAGRRGRLPQPRPRRRRPGAGPRPAARRRGHVLRTGPPLQLGQPGLGPAQGGLRLGHLRVQGGPVQLGQHLPRRHPLPRLHPHLRHPPGDGGRHRHLIRRLHRPGGAVGGRRTVPGATWATATCRGRSSGSTGGATAATVAGGAGWAPRRSRPCPASLRARVIPARSKTAAPPTPARRQRSRRRRPGGAGATERLAEQDVHRAISLCSARQLRGGQVVRRGRS